MHAPKGGPPGSVGIAPRSHRLPVPGCANEGSGLLRTWDSRNTS